MRLQPLLAADMAIQIHVFSAMAAVFLGAFILFRPKGTALHKAMGRVWIGLMLITATSALFIHEIRLVGPFSPIHLFSIFTYVSIFNGLRAIIIERDVRRHRVEMQGLYIGALMLAGAFTLLPGRRMHTILFGADAGWAQSLVAIGLVLSGSAFFWLRWRRDALRRPLPSRS